MQTSHLFTKETDQRIIFLTKYQTPLPL